MSGFDVKRFVGLSDSQREEFECSVCLGILANPVDTQCGHTFCYHCIHRWTQTQDKTCPQCRQPLAPKKRRSDQLSVQSNSDYNTTDISLTKPYNKFYNLWQNLKIKCDFYPNGCLEVLSLKCLPKHLEECLHNKCSDCELRVGKPEEHNCVQQLKHELKKEIIKKESIIEELNGLKSNSDQLQRKYDIEVNRLKTELEMALNEKRMVEIEKLGLNNKLRRYESEF